MKRKTVLNEFKGKERIALWNMYYQKGLSITSQFKYILAGGDEEKDQMTQEFNLSKNIKVSKEEIIRLINNIRDNGYEKEFVDGALEHILTEVEDIINQNKEFIKREDEIIFELVIGKITADEFDKKRRKFIGV